MPPFLKLTQVQPVLYLSSLTSARLARKTRSSHEFFSPLDRKLLILNFFQGSTIAP